MSEHAPRHHEKVHSHELHRHKEADHNQQERLKQLLEAAEKSRDNKEDVHRLHQEAKQEAIGSKDFPAIETQEQDNSHADNRAASRELKQLTFDRTLTRVRKQLKAPSRTLSKVVHQPIVDGISRAGEKTVARPSGLLGGGIFAFAGSSVFLWTAQHYGFIYNYLLFFLLFIGGFAIGATLELVIDALKRKKVRT